MSRRNGNSLSTSATRIRLVSIAITLGSLGLAIVHAVWPQIKLDTVTLGLIALAVLPWLRGVIKSVDIPGFGHVELEELMRRQEQTEQRVEAVATKVNDIEEKISLDPALTYLEQLLLDFRTYFINLGFQPRGGEVRVIPNPDPKRGGWISYDPERDTILIGRDSVSRLDDDSAFREYTHHVLFATTEIRYKDMDIALREVVSGLAFY